MARARRSRARRGGPISEAVGAVGVLVRPELIGALLVIAAAVAVPFVFPLADLLAGARDGLVETFGLHVFTLIVLIAALGVLLAFRYTWWLREQRRHLLGTSLLVVFSAGLLGLWQPEATVGSIDFAHESAGGEAGRALTSNPWAAVGWGLLLPLGFALLWPVTARRALRATPGALVSTGVALWRGWCWLGLHRAVWGMVRSLFAGVRLPIERRADLPPAPPYGSYEVALDDLAGPAEPTLASTLEAPKRGRRQPKTPVQMPMDMQHPIAEWRHSADGWQLPPIGTLVASVERTDTTADNERRAELIVETLASFGVDSRVTQINEGPTVTQFGVEPGWDVRTRSILERDAGGQPLLDDDGVPRLRDVEVSRTRIRVNRITALQNDLALALATPAVRIEAPVPGKSVVGIEVPNASARIVTLRSVVESAAFQRSLHTHSLPIALGAGVSGDPIVADLNLMPHLLIAGATGSGKSVCLNAIITCLLMNHSPEELRLVLVDPKRVELTTFDAVPHLAFSKIIVDMDKVVGALQAVIHEMESRYRRFAQAGVRNIMRYNEQADMRIPYWVVVIDELADLMIAAPFQVEQQLVRLAQLARATGIHLVVATQRPSVDVVTGLIKANFPTRIAFAMSSQVDSRTVLDQGGAEKLLGRGDMLYVPIDAQKPMRLQGVFVTDHEIEAVVRFWSDGRFESLAPEKHDNLLQDAEQALSNAQEAAVNDDPIVTKALQLAREHERLSTSMLQRRLRIGYPRAARIMDTLQERGVVGPPDGPSGSREVREADALDADVALEAADDEALLDEDDEPEGSLEDEESDDDGAEEDVLEDDEATEDELDEDDEDEPLDDEDEFEDESLVPPRPAPVSAAQPARGRGQRWPRR